MALRRSSATPAHRATEYGEQLTDRELAVLTLVAEGMTQRQIAAQLFISHNTVKSHLKNAYRKLGAASRADAIRRVKSLEAGEAWPAASPESPG